MRHGFEYGFNPASISKQWQETIMQIVLEIDRGNVKHGHGPLATPIEVVAILAEELGEYAQAVLKQDAEHAREELLQVAAVAINHLCGTGPHYSTR